MSGSGVFCFAETADQASELAQALGLRCHAIEVHRFPDRETLVRVTPPPATAFVYRSLDDPNAKLVELMLAASALRGNGTRRVILVAPYLAYMRQDRAFHSGEAVSQKVIGRLLADTFDGLITVDPHLHRIHALSDAVPGIEAIALSAAPLLAAALDPADTPLLVGPDGESRRWVEAVAAPRGLEALLGHKQRGGDREVRIRFEDIDRCKGRRIVLVDDLISSGETLIEAARRLCAAGAASIEALATHCLAGAADLARMEQAGIVRVQSTDTVPGPAASLSIAPLLAADIRRRWAQE